MKKQYYVAYGSNMNLEQMEHRCPTAKVVGKTVLKNYELTFRGREVGVATIERKQDSEVPVLVWEIQPDDEKSLDVYEGYPHLYRKEYIPAKVGSEHTELMVYVMNEGRQLAPPSMYYYNVIKEGYKSAEIDVKILDDYVLKNSDRIKHNQRGQLWYY